MTRDEEEYFYYLQHLLYEGVIDDIKSNARCISKARIFLYK